ncbi:hypothetical protein LCGC14_0626130 [marine sediment metagenome]|uniref:Uncharacterized protein n=1 Tax=marine sediment metagenome TaxID=412755 RepID=A0A0F9UBU5_9ZZZZ
MTRPTVDEPNYPPERRLPIENHRRTLDRRNEPNRPPLTTSDVFGMRHQVLDFGCEMEKELKAHDHKTGWRELPVEALLRKLEIEIEELRVAIEFETITDAMGEAVDVGNFALMVWDRLRAEKETTDGI